MIEVISCKCDNKSWFSQSMMSTLTEVTEVTGSMGSSEVTLMTMVGLNLDRASVVMAVAPHTYR